MNSQSSYKENKLGRGCLAVLFISIALAVGVWILNPFNPPTHSSSSDNKTPTLAPPPSTGTVDLLTAVEQQLVTVSFTSNGGASGDAIDITLHRFKSQNSDIQVTLPPGLI